MKILVIGATGRVGRFLVGELVAAGACVRALVRNPERAAGLDPACEVVPGDLDDPDSLRPAFAGVTQVFLLCKESARLPAHERNAVDAARDAGVERIVKLSAWGAGQGDFPLRMVRQHGRSEDLVVRSGLPYILLRPNYFMQNLAAHAQQIQTGRLRACMGDARISMIDARDVAAVAARVLLETRHVQRAYELSGPVALRYADVAETLSRVLQRPIAYEDIEPEEAQGELLALGLPEAKVADILDVYAAYRNGVGAEVTDDAERLLGRAPRTLDQFVRDWPLVHDCLQRRSA